MDILQRLLNPDAPVQSRINNLDHYDGQTFDTDPFSDWVGPYIPDPSDPLSPQVYEHLVRIYTCHKERKASNYVNCVLHEYMPTVYTVKG